MNNAEDLKSVMSLIFMRKGHDGTYTRLFDNLDPSQRHALLSNVTLREGELPVIGSTESATEWLIITTDRIVWSLGDNKQSLRIQDIKDVVADFRKLVGTGRPKDQMRELVVLSMSGEQYILQVEEGAPLIGVWNALKNVGARNRHKE